MRNVGCILYPYPNCSYKINHLSLFFFHVDCYSQEGRLQYEASCQEGKFSHVHGFSHRVAGDWTMRLHAPVGRYRIVLYYPTTSVVHVFCAQSVSQSINQSIYGLHLSSPLHWIFGTGTFHLDRLQEKGSRHEEEDSFRKEVNLMMKGHLIIFSFFNGANPQGGDDKKYISLINFDERIWLLICNRAGANRFEVNSSLSISNSYVTTFYETLHTT